MTVIAIDGPVGAGKSTVARLLAQRLGLAYVDSGATYRLVGIRALGEQVALDDPVALGALAERVAAACSLGPDRTLWFQGEPVPPEIRLPPVSEAASKAAAFAEVRRPMVELQRRLVPPEGAVMEGRDIGTVVLPHADLKVFLDADPATRALRRSDEANAGADSRVAVDERDRRDSTRAASPLTPAPGALVIDTSSRSPEDVVDEIMRRLGPSSAPAAQLKRGSRPVALERRRPARPEPDGPLARIARRLVRGTTTALLRALFRMRIAGQDGVPRAGPAILAANHRSLLDIPAVAALTGRKVWFMGKDELFRLGPLSSAFRALGGFPVRRGRPDRRALEMATGLLLQGELLAVYPEGTRTPGARFQAMEDGLAYLALRTGAPVIPVAISGTEAVFPPGKRLPRLVRIRALVGEPVWLDGPLEGVIPRSRIKAGTAVLQQRLRDVAYALEPGFRELEGGTAAGA